jgi:hypothetical protein
MQKSQTHNKKKNKPILVTYQQTVRNTPSPEQWVPIDNIQDAEIAEPISFVEQIKNYLNCDCTAERSKNTCVIN